MEELKREGSSKEKKQARPINRRRLLKMMATTTGAMGASFLLPAKWTKPLIDMIILPAHAATTPENTPIISGFTISGSVVGDGISKPRISHYGQFAYSDGPCEVNEDDTTLQYTVTGGGELNFESGYTISKLGGIINGTPCFGNIGFSFFTNAVGETLSINLTVNGRSSNWDSDTIPNSTFF